MDTMDDSILNLPVMVKDSARFDFLRELYGTPKTLHIVTASVNRSTGMADLRGYDSYPLIDKPFTI